MLSRCLVILALPFMFSCNGWPEEKGKTEIKPGKIAIPDSLNSPRIEFYTSEYDFGRVYEGENVGWFFKFKNTGSKPLLIKNAYGSCGCTVPEFSKEPVVPGEEGTIKVIFNTKGRTGIQSKTITVETNASNNPEILSLKAEIIKH